MNPQLIIAALIAAAGFGSAWTLQNWRYGAKENERAKQELVDQRNAATTAIRRTEAVITAQSAATVRATALRRDADGSRSALLGLSNAADTALRESGTSLAACTVRAATFRELFIASSTEYESLAGKASRHASDIQTLTDGWPK